jgi:ABC-type multidrug transport system fused ATPase/permease subunit
LIRLRSFAWKSSLGFRWKLAVAWMMAVLEAAPVPVSAIFVVEAIVLLLEGENHSFTNISWWIAGLAFIGLFAATASYIRVYAVNSYGSELTMSLRLGIFKKILARPAQWFDMNQGVQGGHLSCMSP